MIENHIARTVSKEIVQKRIEMLKIGQRMQDLPEELWHPSFRFYVKEDPTRKGGPNMRMIRLDPDKPSLTVTGFIFNKFVHPYENRFITVREAARLQGFPDNVAFTGSLSSTQQQVGNAVPIPLAKAIFSEILQYAEKIDYPNRTLKGLSLFCGAGGLDIGASLCQNMPYKIATLLSLDNWIDACTTLSHYAGKNTIVKLQDISMVENPRLYWQKNTAMQTIPDIVYGGPPCQAFSQAGKQKALADDRGVLIYEFLRFIENINPPFFVMENVSNIVSIYHGNLHLDILKKMTDYGYNVSFAIMNAADYGTPQLRKRAVFIGTKKEFGQVGIPAPTRSENANIFGLPPYKTVGEAFNGLPILRPTLSTHEQANV